MSDFYPELHKLELVIPYEKIIQKVKELAKDISKDYAGKPLVMVATLKGSFIFLADMVRELDFPVLVDFISVSSYEGTSPSNEVKYHYGPLHDVKDKYAIVIEDIIDTGATVKHIIEKLKREGARNVKVCTLLKRKRKDSALIPDYLGFTIKEGFVVGYGLDYNELHRNLKGIYKLQV
jgi:hypoxanthine phosphoribosyltransferase